MKINHLKTKTTLKRVLINLNNRILFKKKYFFKISTHFFLNQSTTVKS
jgi:hypothetical protein